MLFSNTYKQLTNISKVIYRSKGSKFIAYAIIVKSEEQVVEEIKANKMPIGKYHIDQPFVTHKVTLKAGDTIYIFSDGFSDQFGGVKGKKLKSANFKKLLISMHNENLSTQKNLLEDAFTQWQGDLEQVDDVLVIGFRFS